MVWTVVFGGRVVTTVWTTVTGETPEPPSSPDPDPDPEPPDPPDPEPPSIGTTEYLGTRGTTLAGSTIGSDRERFEQRQTANRAGEYSWKRILKCIDQVETLIANDGFAYVDSTLKRALN